MKWDPLEGEQKQPKKLDFLLDSLLHKLSGSSSQDITVIIDKWESIVGEKFSQITYPTHIKNNKLHIQTNDAVIAQELEWRKAQILNATKSYISSDRIEALKITIKKT
ncbi:MAG: hypothetical protein CL453_02255 [Acidimicrobiaceae bacterium]|nr:hypothetical protein [Acidimicrobiaceae bacterium]|tara:strand:- start:2043 stop:2366 length:324 start_codon:yes stop_codon:yes gene_type:complete